MKGMSPLPFEEDEITEMLSYLFTAIAAIWSWWKNNSFTKNAIEADEVLAQLKKGSE
jgi:SPP1 family holin